MRVLVACEFSGVGTESQEQQSLMQWCELMAPSNPALQCIYAIPNAGRRSPRIGAQMKREGLRPGVPDICLPVARGRWHALYIEMKVGANKQTKAQIEWAARLHAQGNLVVLCRDGWKPASEVIMSYLEGKL